MYKTSTPVISSLALVIFLGAGQGTAAPPAVDFNREIRPILAGKCFNCHGADEGSRKAKLRLDLREEAIKEREGMFSLKPAQPEESEVIRRILSTDPEEVMPPPKTGHAVTATEAALLKQWIAEGASYAEHWAFQKPVRPRWPQVSDLSWARNGIDFFVLQKLEQSGLKPSPTASRPATHS
jgi:hypothetical protein